MRPIVMIALGLVLTALAGLIWFLHDAQRASVPQDLVLSAPEAAAPAPAAEPGEALYSRRAESAVPAVASESAAAEVRAPEPPRAARPHGFTREERLSHLQNQKKAFEECLHSAPGILYANGYQLDLISIAALLDAQHREQVNEAQVRISLSPSHPGEHRFVYGNHVYAFDYSEFPGHEKLQHNCSIALGDDGTDPASLDFPPELQSSVMERANSALELLTRGG